MTRKESAQRTALIAFLLLLGLTAGVALGTSAGAALQDAQGSLDRETVPCDELPNLWSGAGIIAYDPEDETLTLSWSTGHEHRSIDDDEGPEAQSPSPDKGSITRTISAVPSDCDDPLLAEYLRSVSAVYEDIDRADCNRLSILVDAVLSRQPREAERPGEENAELRPPESGKAIEPPNRVLVLPEGWTPEAQASSPDLAPFELDLDIAAATLEQCARDFG